MVPYQYTWYKDSGQPVTSSYLNDRNLGRYINPMTSLPQVHLNVHHLTIVVTAFDFQL